MRESLRRLPPAYVRGSYPNRSAESLPLPRRTEETRRPNCQDEEEDLPPYSKADPLADDGAHSIASANHTGGEAGTGSRAPGSNNQQFWVPRRDSSGEEEEAIEERPHDHSSYERDVIEHIWREAQQNEADANSPRTSFERRQRTVAPPHRLPSPHRIRIEDADLEGSNVETGPPRRRRGKRLCCECSKLCWAFWMFWVLVIVIPAAVSAAQVW